jgi:hypothetical protein
MLWRKVLQSLVGLMVDIGLSYVAYLTFNPAVQFLVVTVVGSYEFEDSFEVSFPADTVLQVLVKAGGSAEKSVQIKPHYERNVTLEMQIPLLHPTPTPAGVQG